MIAYICVVLIGVFASFFLIPKYTAELMSSFTTGAKAQNIIIAVVLAYYLGILTDITRKYTEDTIVPSFTKHVREYLYEKVIKSHRSDRQVELGKLLDVISNFPYVIRSAAIDIIKTYIPYTVALIVLIGYIFSIDKQFGYLQIATFFVYVITIWLMSKNCIKTSKQSYVDYMNLSETVQDKIINIESVYAAQQENREIEYYNQKNSKNMDTYRDNLRTLWKLRVCEELIIGASFIAFNYMIIKRNIPKKTAIALYVAEIYYFIRILQTTQSNIVGLFMLIGEGKAMTDFMDTLALEGNEEQSNQNSKPKGRITKTHITKNIGGQSLVIENAWFRYDYSGPWVLENFNFSANTGDKIWIKGSSGCGKSTLFKLILGGLTLNKGTITLFGNSDPNTIRENTSVVDQHTKLFHDTVIRNIMYGNNATENDVKRILKKLNTNIYDKLQDGLYSDAGVGGENLSGGQRQLTILLRCYFRPATVVLMDEPISAIDEENMEVILKAIELISKGRTLLVISHSDKIRDVTNKVVKVC
tara:strand:- start:4363 stop:5952 length:1590 start_codon:yes stop_codon:yes gene_type:complete